MAIPQPARMLRIHMSESDRYGSTPLFEAIVAKCRELRIAGATVFQGLEGYGESAEMHRAHLVHHDRPLVVIVIDTAENLDRLLAQVEPMMDAGVIAIADVEMTRVTEPAV